MNWEFQQGDFVINKRKTLQALKIYEILELQGNGIFNSAAYEVERRDVRASSEYWPKIFLEAHYEKLDKNTAQLLYGGLTK